tara:strand:+ start:135 stop:1058 length:924 start_codon:yes stop_codon:yes gene_type:complete
MVVTMNNDEKYEHLMNVMDEFTYDWNPEWADDPTKPILKITKSSLGQFGWCPTKYGFSYIQRLPQDQTEAMRKGTIIHNAREDFFNEFDIKKAENMTNEEVVNYCSTLFPIDEYYDTYLDMATFEAQRFIEAKEDGKLDEFLPVANEGKFDAEITFRANTSKKFPLQRDYKIHLQGIIDRIFREGNNLIPMELKTGPWKENSKKYTDMRKEMAFYKYLIEACDDTVLIKNGIDPTWKVTHWSWYYPTSDFFYVEAVKKRTMTAVTDAIAKLLKAYEDSDFPAKYFYKSCSHCSFFGICEAAQEDSWL